jgi:hypothetical protein
MTDRPGRATDGPGRPVLWIGSIAAIVAALCYSSFLLSPWTDAASTASSGFVSELEDPGQPFAWLYRTSDVLAGVGILVAAWALWRLVAGRRWAATGVALLVLTGVGSVLDAATSMQCDPGASAQCAQNEHTAFGLISQLLALHTDSGLLGFVGSAAGAAVVGVAVVRRWPLWGRLQVALGIAMASCGLVDIILLLLSSSIGTTERSRVLLTSGWFLVVGLLLGARTRSRAVRSRMDRAVTSGTGGRDHRRGAAVAGPLRGRCG